MKVLLNIKAENCDKSDLFYINALLDNKRKNNIILICYNGKKALATISNEYKNSVSLICDINEKTTFRLYIFDTNTIIYCNRFEIVEV